MTVRTCIQCGETLSLERGFYLWARNARRGRMRTCKGCHRLNVRHNRILKRHYYRAQWQAQSRARLEAMRDL